MEPQQPNQPTQPEQPITPQQPVVSSTVAPQAVPEQPVQTPSTPQQQPIQSPPPPVQQPAGSHKKLFLILGIIAAFLVLSGLALSMINNASQKTPNVPVQVTQAPQPTVAPTLTEEEELNTIEISTSEAELEELQQDAESL
jgi:hypothetical protein